MKPSRIWSGSTKFIAFGSRSGSIGSFLCAEGFSRVLAVCKSEKEMRSIGSRHPDLLDRTACCDARKQVRRNNADVLILSGRAQWHLGRYRHVRHANHVVWCPTPGVAMLFGLLGCLVNVALGRFTWAGIVPCRQSARGTRCLLVFRIRRRRPHGGARCYIPHTLGIRGFLDRLAERKVEHAVLRWFEALPHVEPGEDLDLLVDDDSLEALRVILDEGPGIQPCDVYTVTGLPGTDFRKMPYFPPYLSASILAEAQPHKGLCRVPSPRHHFLSLAYHALYHKGMGSGVPCRRGEAAPKGRPEHDYPGILGAMAGDLEIDVGITLEDLDAYLEVEGWRPPHDMLIRLARHNRWLGALIGLTDEDPEDAGLAVFILREEALARGGLEKLLPLLAHHGFDVIETRSLTPRESRYGGRSIRGGNWGRGPWKVSGGLPAEVVVAYDSEPIPPTPRDKKQFPYLANARLLMKKKIRDAFNQHDPKQPPCNVLHSSDNGREAWEYIGILMPEAAEAIRAQIGEIQRAYSTCQPVLRTLTRYGRRAKVELIEFDGRLAVKKTFKACQKRYGRREATAMRELSNSIDAVPPLLTSDDRSIVYPYYDDVLQYRRSSGKLLPLRVAKQAIQALRDVYEAGYALIDAHAENILVDRKQGLKLIDFEFLYRYDHKPSGFEQSFDMLGPPPDFNADLPDGGGVGYARGWQPYVGLSLGSLLHDPVWVQHAKRVGYYVTHLPRLLPKRVRHFWRRARATAKVKFPAR